MKDICFNIKCGNSLVGTDFYAKYPELSEEEKAKVNPFDWQSEFPLVFKDGGFDAVVGNPPYIRAGYFSHLKNYFYDSFKAYEGNSDIYVLFFENALKVLKEKGHVSFITSNKWLLAKYGMGLRKILAEENTIKKLINFSGRRIFENADVDTSIIIIEKLKPNKKVSVQVGDKTLNEKEFKIAQAELNSNNFSLGEPKILGIKKKIEKIGTPLKDWDVKIQYGIKTGFNEAFIIDTATKDAICKEDPKSAEIMKPVLRGRDIKRYKHEWKGLWLIFIPWHFPLHNQNVNGVSKEAEKEFQKQYPAIYKHLLKYKNQLESRNKAETGIRYEWYALQRCANTYLDDFEKEKIIWPELGEVTGFYLDRNKFYTNAKCYVMTNANIFLLTILNSKITTFYMKNTSSGLANLTYNWGKIYVEQIPIPKLDLSKKSDKAVHDKLSLLSENMLELNKKLLSTNNPNDKTKIQRQIEATDKEIDSIVYKLYGLTDEEIKIVEEEIRK